MMRRQGGGGDGCWCDGEGGEEALSPQGEGERHTPGEGPTLGAAGDMPEGLRGRGAEEGILA